MTSCTGCDAPLTSRLVCEACGELQRPEGAPTPFDCFGLEPSARVDTAATKKRLLALSRALHPDFFGSAEESVRQLAVDNSAELNAAYEVLSDDVRRADWLVRHLGGPDENEERQMPQAFLMEVMEWNELLEEAEGAAADSAERTAARELGATLRSERADLVSDLLAALDPLPEPGATSLVEVRQKLNAVRYLDRALAKVAELTVSSPSAP